MRRSPAAVFVAALVVALFAAGGSAQAATSGACHYRGATFNPGHLCIRDCHGGTAGGSCQQMVCGPHGVMQPAAADCVWNASRKTRCPRACPA